MQRKARSDHRERGLAAKSPTEKSIFHGLSGNALKKISRTFVTFLETLTYNLIQELFTIKIQGDDR